MSPWRRRCPQYLGVSLALIAFFRSVRILAINGGVAGAEVELYRTARNPRRVENLRGANILGVMRSCEVSAKREYLLMALFKCMIHAIVQEQ